MIFVNGRFRSQALSGVQRVAEEITGALLQISPGDVRVLAPSSQLTRQFRGLAGVLSGHLWEQAVLPLSSRHGVLVSLCNTGPILHRRQVVCIHDANVFANPDSYSAAFRAWYSAALPKLARNASCVVTVSEFSRRELAQRLHVDVGRIEVVSNAADHMDRIDVDPSALLRFGLRPRGYALAIGSFALHKNHQLLERAARESMLRLPLVVVGGVNERVFGNVSAKTSALRSVGRVDDSTLKALLQAARLFVFPSTYEGFGLPPLEAMRCGCPVLSSRSAAMPEVLGDAATYFDAHDLGEFRDTFNALVEDDARLEGLRLAGLRRSSMWTWRMAAERYREIAKGVVAG